ncbi:MAG: diaminopimelate epimerase [Bacteroidota bacterium]|nr:MAG: diaminopimelate epimerase [Bacteroidota bacterium]
MNLPFYKYQGAGNDFVIVDNRHGMFDRGNQQLIQILCNRRFGIGADGLMLLQDKAGYDFEMVYFNSDGKEGSMCGNGGRCIVAFAQNLGLIKNTTRFLAADGEHLAELINTQQVNLKMSDVTQVEINEDFYYLNTGSPHYVKFVKGIEALDVYSLGRQIRYNERFKANGTNVNFVEEINHRLMVRTYERGVEDETLACGTGITASAIAFSMATGETREKYDMKALGGDLIVRFTREENRFTNIWLEGPATFVFKGEITL